VTLFFGVALYFRIYLPYDKVFSGDWIKFTSADAYYNMRLIDNLVHNFPHYTSIDPYFLYPGATAEININFFGWLIASVTWLIGLGSPTQHIIDVVGVYFPAILGALTIIPVYFIGKELFGRWAGVISASLLAMLPGEFLGRSMLGFTDYHVAETLFVSITMLFLILAIKSASQRQSTFSHFKHRDWATIGKPIIYSLLAGIFLGIYIFTWLGALLFVFIIFIYFVIQFIIDHLTGKSTDYPCFVGVTFFSVALLMSMLISAGMLYLASLVIALLVPLVLSGASRLMASKKIKPAYYPLTLLGLGLAGLGLFYLVNPSLLSSMLSAFRILIPAGAQLTTIEMQPLISSSYANPLMLAWGNFTTNFFIGLFSLVMLIICLIVRRSWTEKLCPDVEQGSADKVLLVVWSLIILAVTLAQRRFGYYFAVNIALLTGYLSWRVLEMAGFRELTAKAVEAAKEIGGKKARLPKGGFPVTLNRAVMALAVLVIFFVVFFWNIEPARIVASTARFAPSDAWVSSLTWLKENTPEPFGDSDAYYQLHELPPLGESYQYSESAYGVLAWWDYGYWITRIAHRLPVANPSQSPQALTSVASFFTSQDEELASEIAQEKDLAYVVIDHETALGKFWAVATWAGQEQTEYFDIYLVPQENQLARVQLFYPEYYRSLASRLYNFDGKAVIPEDIIVISYQEQADEEGNIYKVVTSAEQFAIFGEAEAYLLSQETANYRIVGVNPLSSPVPLEALEHYQLIYSSESGVKFPNWGSVPAVKIFEYVD